MFKMCVSPDGRNTDRRRGRSIPLHVYHSPSRQLSSSLQSLDQSGSDRKAQHSSVLLLSDEFKYAPHLEQANIPLLIRLSIVLHGDGVRVVLYELSHPVSDLQSHIRQFVDVQRSDEGMCEQLPGFLTSGMG